MNTVELPIAAKKEEILLALENNRVIILEAQTGSGKSTQLPQYLLDQPGRIVCTQPRRVAAVKLATFVASKQDCALGTRVGYKHKGDNKTRNDTQLTYMTEGCFIREYMSKKNVNKYKYFILDEVHEMTTNMFIILGILRHEMNKNQNFRIVITSATLDATFFQLFFAGRLDKIPLIKVPGRNYTVQVHYAQNDCDEWDMPKKCAEAVLCLLDSSFPEDGDFLVFLHGGQEIESCCSMIRAGIKDIPGAMHKVYALYSTLPQEHQDAAVNANKISTTSGGRPSRNVIVASNMAESSVTLERVVFVIDSGLAKEKVRF